MNNFIDLYFIAIFKDLNCECQRLIVKLIRQLLNNPKNKK